MSAAKKQAEHIIIVGGGLGGLTAALALQQQGFQVTVLEQARTLAEVGAGVQLSANATRVLSLIGLDGAVAACGAQPTGKEIRLWNTGQTWQPFVSTRPTRLESCRGLPIVSTLFRWTPCRRQN